MQIVAHSNHQTVGTQNDFLFCQTRFELTQLEREARSKLSPRDDGHRAARFADGIVEIVRRRHRHAANCAKCLVSEALTQ